jgi:2-phosphosulfolactate phosphatase
MNKKLHVILTPALSHLYEMKEADVVIIDILRATTSICVAMANGAKSIIPVADIQEAKEYKRNGYLVAAERNGEKVEGFDFGNSPQSFSMEAVQDKTIVFTTTNGTRCIDIASESGAEQIIIGSFLNLSSVADMLKSSDRDLFLFCAGWKDKFNLEDTLFAGALADALKDDYQFDDDATEMAMDLYRTASDDMVAYIQKASHIKRFDKLGIAGDGEFCLQLNVLSVVPLLKGIHLERYQAAAGY